MLTPFLYAVMALALVVVRRRPVAAQAAIAAATAGTGLSDLGEPISVLAAIPNAIGLYTVAASCRARTALATLAGTVVLVMPFDVVAAAEQDQNLLEALGMYPIVVGIWAAGRAVRAHRRRAADAADEVGALAERRDDLLRAAVAEERARLARELHDVVAHNLSVMVVQAGAARSVFEAAPDAAREALTAAEATGREALAELGRLAGEGGTVAGLPPGLSAVERLVAQARGAGVDATLEVLGEPRPVSAGLDLSAYRILQEALTNAVKHARGSSGRVTVRWSEAALELEVRDDGAGSSAGLPGSGRGLVGLRERAALFGGTLHAGPDDGGGFAVRARLPLDTAEVAA